MGGGVSQFQVLSQVSGPRSFLWSTPVPGSFPGPFWGGTQVPGSFSGLWYHVLSGSTPVPGPFPGLWSWVLSMEEGTPVLVGGLPPPWKGPGTKDLRKNLELRYPQDWDTPCPGLGYPLWPGLGYPSPKTGYTAGGMPRAVSLRSTFLSE